MIAAFTIHGSKRFKLNSDLGLPCCLLKDKAYNENMFETAKQLEPDPVIEAYKKDVDRTLIRENLRLTVAQRLDNLAALQRFAEELRRAPKEERPSGD